MNHVVVDLGFGDSGKGAITDRLAAQDPDNTIVVRYTGGSQAGHNVVIGERSHIHSSFASGTLGGVRSHMSAFCPINPHNLINEAEVLQAKVDFPLIERCSVSPLCPLITVYDQVWNQITAQRSGCKNTVGVGVGAAMHRHENSPVRMFVSDLLSMGIYRQKIEQVRQYYMAKARELRFWKELDELREIKLSLLDEAYDMLKWVSIKPDAFAMNNPHVVLEGAQGVMLDRDHGFFPDVTYGHTTARNAMALLELIPNPNNRKAIIHEITRCYQTRHGAGPMGNGARLDLKDATNSEDGFQGEFRSAELDLDMLGYAHTVNTCYLDFRYTEQIVLQVTCLDRRPGFDVSKLIGLIGQKSTKAWYGADRAARCAVF